MGKIRNGRITLRPHTVRVWLRVSRVGFKVRVRVSVRVWVRVGVRVGVRVRVKFSPHHHNTSQHKQTSRTQVNTRTQGKHFL